MAGNRKWRFTVGAATIGGESTDFWLDRVVSGNPPQYNFTVRRAWQAPPSASTGEGKRVLIEDRYAALNGYIGRRGTLDLDYGTVDRSRSFYNVTLTNITPVGLGAQNNTVMEYDLAFSYPVAGFQLARSFRLLEVGTGEEMFAREWLGLFVKRTKEDRTVFKSVFRNAEVRVNDGPGKIHYLISGVFNQIDTPGLGMLDLRQANEAVQTELQDLQGGEYQLEVDGFIVATVHFNRCEASRLDLPDATVLDLEFITGYAGTANSLPGEAPESTGIYVLNGLNGTEQTFTFGTAGTDANISSLGTVHTFNLPTASATNRGLLSTADWAAFNAKVNTVNPGINANDGLTCAAGLWGVTYVTTAGRTPASVVALPPPVNGVELNFQATGGGGMRIERAGSDTINYGDETGSTYIEMESGSNGALTLWSDGTDWHVKSVVGNWSIN